MAYLTCKNLTLGYEGHAIVSDLNFKVGKGDYLCIVGENGTGKSTLIKTLLHLQDAISGEVMAGDGLKDLRSGVSATANGCSERFSGNCRRNQFFPVHLQNVDGALSTVK